MTFTLGTNVQIGQKVKTKKGWRKIKDVTLKGIAISDDFIYFGDKIFGWKNK